MLDLRRPRQLLCKCLMRSRTWEMMMRGGASAGREWNSRMRL